MLFDKTCIIHTRFIIYHILAKITTYFVNLIAVRIAMFYIKHEKKFQGC
jgi:nitrogen fixation protein FixH